MTTYRGSTFSQPDAKFFEWLGRLVSAVAQLEYVVAELTAMVEQKDQTRVDSLAKGWAQTRDAFNAATATMAAGTLRLDLKSFLCDVEARRDDRNALAHSLVVLEVEEGWGLEDRPWHHYHPKSRSVTTLPSDAELRELHARVGGLTMRGVRLQSTVADSLRTAEGGEA